MKFAEEILPRSILDRAMKRGHTFFWRPKDIPDVIEAARVAGIRSLGGALNFIGLRGTPSENVGRCECYWVKALVAPSASHEWNEMVENAARSTQDAFAALPKKYDFHKEGLTFPTVKVFADRGGNLDDIMYFYWTMENEDEYREGQRLAAKNFKRPESGERPQPNHPNQTDEGKPS